ncbi:MAG: hypothetical protein Q7R47_03285 [Candidatus Diapherotrites archaeon]|nr:hypothetical protein [Candidatus Diapherotrites archaeon]
MVFSIAGLLLSAFGFMTGQLLIALAGAVLVMVYLGLAVLLASRARFFARAGAQAATIAPVRSYLLTVFEVQLAVLFLGAAALLLLRFFGPML